MIQEELKIKINYNLKWFFNFLKLSKISKIQLITIYPKPIKKSRNDNNKVPHP